MDQDVISLRNHVKFGGNSLHLENSKPFLYTNANFPANYMKEYYRRSSNLQNLLILLSGRHIAQGTRHDQSCPDLIKKKFAGLDFTGSCNEWIAVFESKLSTFPQY